MSNLWFKFYGGEYLSDPKIERLSPTERSCWVTLLCLASMNGEGNIEFLTIESLLNKSGIQYDPYHPEEWEKALSVLEKFSNMKMIEASKEGTIQVLNWKKRQETHLTEAERAKSYRDRKKDRHEIVTAQSDDRHPRIEENRIEYNNTKPIAAIAAPFSLKEEIKKLEENPRRDLNIIAFYFEEKKPKLENRGQFNVALRRHLRAAKSLIDFSDDQITKAAKKAAQEYPEWTLDTVVKLVTK